MAKQPITITQDGKNVTVKLTNVPLAFADDVWEPKEETNDDGSSRGAFVVQTVVLLDKDTDAGKVQIAGIKEAMKLARAAEWPDGKVSIAPNCYAMQDGEPLDEGTGERQPRWDGFEGRMYLSPKKRLKAKTKDDALREIATKHPVQVLGPRKTAVDGNGRPCFPTLTKADDLVYSGAVCDVIIQIWPYNGVGKKTGGGNHPNRINASLECIKFVEHGTRMGGGKRVDAQNAFDEEDDEDGDNAPAAPAASASDPLDALG